MALTDTHFQRKEHVKAMGSCDFKVHERHIKDPVTTYDYFGSTKTCILDSEKPLTEGRKTAQSRYSPAIHSKNVLFAKRHCISMAQKGIINFQDLARMGRRNTQHSNSLRSECIRCE
ncbi:hypothetical protein ACU8KH_03048 [Lachancea thermotolerans]